MADEVINVERLKMQEVEMAEPTDDLELSEELADTAIIEQLLDGYIQEVSAMFHDALDVSLEGNPVKTHLELNYFGQDIVEMAYKLRAELIARIAKRTEELNLEEAATGRGWVYEATEEAQQTSDAVRVPEQEN